MIWRPGIYRRYIPNRSIKDGAGEAEALCGRARETSRIAVNPRFGRRFTEEKALRVSELRYRPPVGRDSPGPGAVRPAVRRGVEPSHRDRRPPQLVRNLVRNFPRLQCLPRKMQKFDSPWGYSFSRFALENDLLCQPWHTCGTASGWTPFRARDLTGSREMQISAVASPFFEGVPFRRCPRWPSIFLAAKRLQRHDTLIFTAAS